MDAVLPTLLLVAMLGTGGYLWATARRSALQRRRDALVAELDARARAAPGGAPHRPIEVSSPRVIEARAANTPCHRCGREEIDVDDHDAEIVGGERLRAVTTTCRACGARRKLWFRLAAAFDEATWTDG